MGINKLLSSTCTAFLMLICVGVGSAKAAHSVSDSAADSMDNMILVQDVQATLLKMQSLYQNIQELASLGEIGSALGLSDFGSNVTDSGAEFAGSSVPPELAGTNFESSMDDASKMQSFVASDLLPPSDDAGLTDTEAKDREIKRAAVLDSANADGYAAAVAYLSKSTTTNEEVIAPAKESVSSKETVQDKQTAQNELGIARIQAILEGNRLAAELLKVQSANSLANQPRQFGS